MKRVKSAKTHAPAVPIAHAAFDVHLEWRAIVEVIAQDAFETALANGRQNKACLVKYTLLADTTMKPDASPQANEQRLFLPPGQFYLLRETDARVLAFRTEEMQIEVPTYEGVCETEDIEFLRLTANADGSVTIALHFANVNFSRACFFGKNACEKTKNIELENEKWKGKAGYCGGPWCHKNHNQWRSTSDPRLIHCRVHDGPVPNPEPACKEQHWQNSNW